MGKIYVVVDESTPPKSAEWFNQLIADCEDGGICFETIHPTDLHWLEYLGWDVVDVVSPLKEKNHA